MTPIENIRSRMVINQLNSIQEHLEAMERDTYGLEYAPWKSEVDDIWKRIFLNISKMQPKNQGVALQAIETVWKSYISHYGVLTGK